MILVSTNCLKGREGVFEKDFFRVLKAYEDAGIHDIECGACHSYIKDLKLLFEFKRKYNAELTLHSNFPPANEEGVLLNIASADERIRKMSHKAFAESIETCRRLDSGLFSFNAGFLCDLDKDINMLNKPWTYEDAFSRMKEMLLLLLDKASEHDIRLAVENHEAMGTDVIMFTKAEEYERLFREIRHPLLGALLDIGHLRLNAINRNADETGFIEKVRDRIFEFHIHEVKEGKDHQRFSDASVLRNLPI
ncbi:TIM barrel protein, partial [Candidatus Woesearchaeota archaeon]|nr:TIM barrel protein [Candidatus Woesearchaeota archaeon]